MKLLCFNGSLDGEYVNFDRDFFVGRTQSATATLPESGTVPQYMPLAESEEYHIQTFSISRARPTATKRVYVAQLAHSPLTGRQQRTILELLTEQPWKMYKPSIIEDFEQWFAATCYEKTKTLYWLGKRVL